MESPRQPGDAKVQTRAGDIVSGRGGSVGGARKYPRPPTLWRRIIAHTIVPESWALAARYPIGYTLIALLAAILFACLCAGIGDGKRFANEIAGVAARYQAAYPEAPLAVTAEGELKATEAFKEPLQFTFPHGRVVIDPTGQTNVESIKPKTILFTNKEAFACLGNSEEPQRILELQPWLKLQRTTKEKESGGGGGEELLITAQRIRAASVALGCFTGFVVASSLVVGNVLWVAVTMFLICPLIIAVASVGDRGLLVPRRVAYRMVAAMLIPLVLFSGIMHAAGYSIMYTIGLDFALIFWFFTAAAMAVWTGFMAKKIYAPKNK
ncbi:MAG: hypothetical protein FWD53_11605 [Phycisphaerales bacterium]|nr:hypothetical protein [Phycisphaerales bacterium]